MTVEPFWSHWPWTMSHTIGVGWGGVRFFLFFLFLPPFYIRKDEGTCQCLDVNT